jgi:tRNA threonylcarbamoyl adenosine modification protein YeaZ/ribosomal-protein-alanine acetyltransferase
VTRVVLAIDTATPAVTAGVVDQHGQVLAERVTVDARAHAEQITPNVLAAIADAGCGMGDLASVVVGCGPGPFTGLRVGMATAAAYGHALGIPVYGVCSLDAIGVTTTAESLVVTDARRREVYWARYRDGARIVGPAVGAPADVEVSEASAVAGSPAHTALFALPVLDAAYPTTAGLVAAVDNWDSRPGPLMPWYLRRPDAKLPPGEPVTAGPLTRADANRCGELEAQLFSGDDPWPAAAFIAELAGKHNHYVAARIGDKLVGYAGIARLGRTPPFEYEVHTIGVDPAHQGRGIGRLLLDELLAFADGGVVYLEVRTDNQAAMGLYRAMGFVQIGLRKRYYRTSGADAYTMRREATG